MPRKTSKKSHLGKPRNNNFRHSSSSTNEVRIVGGRFKRQQITFISVDNLRPSPDRLRETLFNWIQFELPGSRVLDLCAGSGVLGFEAISRGAFYTTFIELNFLQFKQLKKSAQKLKLPDATFKIYNGDVLNILPKLCKTAFTYTNVSFSNVEAYKPRINTPLTHPVYDIVFIDPPYDLKLYVPILKTLLQLKLINGDSIIYLEDKLPLVKTLAGLDKDYDLLKQTKVGQIYASLVQFRV